MANSRSLQQAVRLALATATAAAGVPALHAQEAPAAQAEAPASMSEVVVTGSRLKTPNETSISPITTISSADVQATGLTRVEDILNNLPMVFAGMNSTTSNGGDGTASIDLRGLGNQRTLVLVDGLRLGPGQGGGRNYSDINEIPATLIERVDVLTGGASAVYGADAVAGVVNFILDTHFEGVKVDAGYHFNQHNNNNPFGVDTLLTAAGDPIPSSSVNAGFGKNASILVGSNFAENKGNATAYVTYDNQGATLQNKFDYSSCTLNPATASTIACGGSSFAAKNGAGGRFEIFGNSGTPIADNTVDGLTNTFRPFAAADHFNYGPYNYYQTPNERWTAGAFVNYEVNSHATVYSSVMYMRNSALTQIAPVPVSVSAFIACANPLLNASEQAVYCNAANQAEQGNPFEVYNGVNYPGLNTYVLRRNVEGGPRIASLTTDQAREVFGIKGDISDDWTYNVSAQHSQVDTQVQNINYLSNSAIQQALNVLPGGVCGGPSNGVGNGPLVSGGTGTPFAPTAGCIPWDLWKGGGVSPAAVAALSVPEQEQLTTFEYVVSGSVTGDLGKYGLKLPSADQGLQANFGAEWREDASQALPDYISQQGLAAGGGGVTVPVAGAFTVSEVFTELRLPIAQHAAFAEDLSLEGGYRYSKYNEGFDTNTYKLGLEWAPIHDLRLRGSYQRAVRAPNIGELFAPQAVGLDGSVDPCAAAKSNATTLTNGETFAQCQRSGVTATQFGNIVPNSSNQYNGLLGGNPHLEPETADTYTVGLVITPSVLPSLTVSFDYFDIKVKNIIASIGGDTILLDCLNNNQFCTDVHRNSVNGSLWLSQQGYVSDLTVNEGELQTSGVDLKASYRQALPAYGSLLFSLEGTYLKQLVTTPVAGGTSYDCHGYFGATCGGGNPTWRDVFNVTWTTPWDGLDVNLRWRYFGSDTSRQLNPSSLLATSSAYLPLSHIGAYNWIDLSAVFNIYKNVRLELGVNNIADKIPPMVVGGDCTTSSGGGNAGSNCNGNTYPGVYDSMGRYLFAHITATF